MTLVTDARAMCRGFASVRVVAGSVDDRGLLDDEEVVSEAAGTFGSVGGALVTERRVLRVVAADFPALVREATIELGAVDDDENLTSYRVLDVRKEGDGTVLRVWVAT